MWMTWKSSPMLNDIDLRASWSGADEPARRTAEQARRTAEQRRMMARRYPGTAFSPRVAASGAGAERGGAHTMTQEQARSYQRSVETAGEPPEQAATAIRLGDALRRRGPGRTGFAARDQAPDG